MTSKLMIRAREESDACLEDGDIAACPHLAAVRYAAGALMYASHRDALHYVDHRLLWALSSFKIADVALDDWHHQRLAAAEQQPLAETNVR